MIVKTRVVLDGSLGILRSELHVRIVVIDFEKELASCEREVAEVVLAVRVVLLGELREVATRRITMAFTSGGKALTPAVSKTLPPVIVVRNASLSARIFSVLMARAIR